MASVAETKPVKPGRLISLDVFRGMTIAGMILVNNAGDWGHIFKPLGHAQWLGCTATDLIFPFFLFIMGVAMTFSFSRRLEEPGGRRELMTQVWRRTFLLFALGAVLHFYAYLAAPWVKYVRIWGVLQRIAICYLVVSFIGMNVSIRGQAGWAVMLLAIYYFLMKFVPVPNYGAGVLEQSGNLAGYLDSTLFGKCCYEFDEKTKMYHDPEGLLSTLPAIATTLSGLLAGHWIRRKDVDGHQKAAGLATAGLLCYMVGALWQYDFPYSKNLWTSSYVLHTSGWGMMVLAACYWTIDVKGITGWTKPFLVYGTNAIAAYVAAGLIAYTTILIKFQGAEGKTIFLKTWIYNTLYKSWIEPNAGPYVASAAYGFTYVVIIYALMSILYRKKIFIKV